MAPNKIEEAPNSPPEAAQNPTDPPPPKKKRRCNWNPSICFELDNVVKIVACGGGAIDLICLGFWLWASVMTKDSTLVMDTDPIQVKLMIIHAFLAVTEMLLFFAVVIRSHILVYVWIFFRIIWLYYAIVVWVVGLNVIQMEVRGEWSTKVDIGLEVFLRIGATGDPDLVMLIWKIAFYTYIPLVLIYSWATVIVGVFACNVLEDFRRLQNRNQSLTVSGMAAEAVRRMSMVPRTGKVHEV